VAMARHLYAVRALTAALRSSRRSSDGRQTFRPAMLQALIWMPEPRPHLKLPTRMEPLLEPLENHLEPWELHRIIASALNFWRGPERAIGSFQVRSNDTEPGYFEIAWVVTRLRDHLVAQIEAVMALSTSLLRNPMKSGNGDFAIFVETWGTLQSVEAGALLSRVPTYKPDPVSM
jgi:hypothetical protein